jgi:hypothetical protein
MVGAQLGRQSGVGGDQPVEVLARLQSRRVDSELQIAAPARRSAGRSVARSMRWARGWARAPGMNAIRSWTITAQGTRRNQAVR